MELMLGADIPPPTTPLPASSGVLGKDRDAGRARDGAAGGAKSGRSNGPLVLKLLDSAMTESSSRTWDEDLEPRLSSKPRLKSKLRHWPNRSNPRTVSTGFSEGSGTFINLHITQDRCFIQGWGAGKFFSGSGS